jgi:D-arabinose 1-dehydrogenase-like Zn-dependent alcohol dehydrogenase
MIRVEACGVCGTDSLTVEGQYTGLRFPRVLGHEVTGRIEAIGSSALSMARRTASRRRLFRWLRRTV